MQSVEIAGNRSRWIQVALLAAVGILEIAVAAGVLSLFYFAGAPVLVGVSALGLGLFVALLVRQLYRLVKFDSVDLGAVCVLLTLAASLAIYGYFLVRSPEFSLLGWLAGIGFSLFALLEGYVWHKRSKRR